MGVLLVDQRGMGRSNPLFCDELDLYRTSSVFSRWPAEAVRSCRERLAATVDLSRYSMEEAAHDLDAVRARLGYPRLNLWGYSYGTRAALTYMRHYPTRVRSAILSGVVPPDYKRPLHYARDAEDALDRLLADCAADPSCAAAFPRPRQELATAQRQAREWLEAFQDQRFVVGGPVSTPPVLGSATASFQLLHQKEGIFLTYHKGVLTIGDGRVHWSENDGSGKDDFNASCADFEHIGRVFGAGASVRLTGRNYHFSFPNDESTKKWSMKEKIRAGESLTEALRAACPGVPLKQ